MTATMILPPGTDRRNRIAWLAARRSGIGSSDASAIVGLNKYACARDVWEDKTGRLPLDSFDEPSEAARWGTLLEPVVREEFAHRSGIGVEPAGTYRSDDTPYLLSNPDGFTDDGGIAEFKTASAWLRGDWDNQVPDHAELQVQHSMGVLGVPHAWVCGLIGGQKLVWQKVERDDALIADLHDIEAKFWARVELDMAPPLDGKDASDGWLTKRFPKATPGERVEVDPKTAGQLRAAFREAAAGKKVDEAAYKAAQNAFRDLIGTAELLVCGEETVATWDHTGNSFDEKAFKAAHPGLFSEYVRDVPLLDKARLLKDHPEMAEFRSRVLRVKGI